MNSYTIPEHYKLLLWIKYHINLYTFYLIEPDFLKMEASIQEEC